VSWYEYAQPRAGAIAVSVLGILSACIIAFVCGCPNDAVMLMAAILVACAMGAYAIDFLHMRRFYSEIRELTNVLEHPYQLHSLVSAPTTPDNMIVFEALRAMGIASANEVAKANAKADEHREFVEGWVHGVKAPLASCGLITQRVAEPERSQLAAELDRVKRQVDAALWYARSDCANNDYAIHEVALADIPRTVCRENARFLIEQGCIPTIDIDDETKVFTDKKQAVFIVTQLVENAAKYGAKNVRFYTEHRVLDSGAERIDLHVEDDGHGIPAEDVGRVFERGFTGSRGREGSVSTGMGLYLASRLCDQLGLGLSISSVDGGGTSATVAFPLDRRQFDMTLHPDS